MIAKALFTDTIDKLKASTTYRMIQHKKALTKMLSIFVISFSTLTLSIITINIPEITLTKEGVLGIDKVEIVKDNSIFGEKKDIQIGERELQLILTSSANINIENIKDIEEVDFQRENFPVDVVAVGEATSEDEIPEDFDLIKNYNLRIRGLT